jgi:hypothetical protein
LKDCVQELFISNVDLDPAYCDFVFFLSPSRKYSGSVSTIAQLHTYEFPLFNHISSTLKLFAALFATLIRVHWCVRHS